ncbi:MAG: alanine racemase [Balneolaceae bacterium]
MENEIDLKLQPSCIEISKSALENNLKFIRERIGDGVKISSVIKGNAYGHGIETFLPMAERCGISHFSVFSADEALKALRARTKAHTHVMIMGLIADEALEWAIENDVSFYVFEMGRLRHAVEAAGKVGRKARIHLQLETGMHRIGFEPEEHEEIIRILHQHPDRLKLEGICTHFAGAESVANYVRIQQQKKRFRDAVEVFRKEFPEIPAIHAANSAAMLGYPDTIYNMVRIGIAQYGFWPSREVYMLLKKEDRQKGKDPLKRILRWTSKVMSVKEVEEGEFVGYGNIHMTNRKERIASVPIGYAHGFGRNLTNTGFVLIRGERAKVVGLVNMNMLTVDVTDIEGVRKGDEVVIVGIQGEREITLAAFGELSNNLNYEVLVRLPADLPRLVV